MIDSTAYGSFLTDNGLDRGLVIADKGFPVRSVLDYYDKHPNLHFLHPLKRNTRYIKMFNLHDYPGVLESDLGVQFCRNSITEDERTFYLYSYRDMDQAMEEEKSWSERWMKKQEEAAQTKKKKNEKAGENHQAQSTRLLFLISRNWKKNEQVLVL